MLQIVDVIGYVRVSTAEQAESGAGLEAQRSAIRVECARRGWHLVGIREDAGASGKSVDGRPGLQEALTAADSGAVQGLVVAKLDRLSRSVMDFAGLMQQSRKRGWALIALDIGVDTTTPQGSMVANVMASFAQFERDLIRQRTREALAVKKRQGVRLGRPRTTSAATLRRVRAARTRGASFAGIANRLNRDAVPTAQGGRAWYPSTVRALLASGSRVR